MSDSEPQSEPELESDDQPENPLLGQELAFRFLARCFYQPPEVEWLDTLTRERLFEEWPLPSGGTETASGLDLLRRWSAGFSRSQAPALAAEFQTLFVGPDRVLVAPWESVHRSRTGLTFQEPTLRVRDAYARFGLESPALHREPDDHIGLELAFVAHLSGLAGLGGLGGLGGGDENEGASRVAIAALRAFLEEHLLEWAPDFFEAVHEHARSDWFRGLALLATGALSETANRLGVAPRPRSRAPERPS